MGESVYYLSGIVFEAVLTIVFACLYFIERKRYILFWCCSWLFFTLSYLSIFLKFTTEYFTLFNVIENATFILAIWAIAQGSIEFFRGKTSKIISVFSFALVIYYCAVFYDIIRHILPCSPLHFRRDSACLCRHRLHAGSLYSKCYPAYIGRLFCFMGQQFSILFAWIYLGGHDIFSSLFISWSIFHCNNPLPFNGLFPMQP